jgi:hypothetical protein
MRNLVFRSEKFRTKGAHRREGMPLRLHRRQRASPLTRLKMVALGCGFRWNVSGDERISTSQDTAYPTRSSRLVSQRLIQS